MTITKFTRPENAMSYRSYNIINNLRKADLKGYLEDVLANENIQVLMPRVIKALESKGFVVAYTSGHSSFFANGEEIRKHGNSTCCYEMFNPSETDYLAWEEDSRFIREDGRPDDTFHFDNCTGFDGVHLHISQVYRGNGADADCSIRVSAFKGYFENAVYDNKYYYEKNRSTQSLACVKIDYRASDRVISNRINKLLEQIANI